MFTVLIYNICILLNFMFVFYDFHVMSIQCETMGLFDSKSCHATALLFSTADKQSLFCIIVIFTFVLFLSVMTLTLI